MKRISTGIQGLDEILEGGFPHPSAILVTGPTGIGKSIFGLQFLKEGADKGEPGFMMQIEGYATDVNWYSERFGWDIKEKEEEGTLLFSSFDPLEFAKFDLSTFHSDIVLRLHKIIDSIKAKRIVIDSITPIGLSIENIGQYRTLVYYLVKALKSKDCTVLFISETQNGKPLIGVEEFVMDGVIELKYEDKDSNPVPSMFIKKMVSTNVTSRKFVIQIDDLGFKVVNPFGESLFS